MTGSASATDSQIGGRLPRLKAAADYLGPDALAKHEPEPRAVVRRVRVQASATSPSRRSPPISASCSATCGRVAAGSAPEVSAPSGHFRKSVVGLNLQPEAPWSRLNHTCFGSVSVRTTLRARLRAVVLAAQDEGQRRALSVGAAHEPEVGADRGRVAGGVGGRARGGDLVHARAAVRPGAERVADAVEVLSGRRGEDVGGALDHRPVNGAAPASSSSVSSDPGTSRRARGRPCAARGAR